MDGLEYLTEPLGLLVGENYAPVVREYRLWWGETLFPYENPTPPRPKIPDEV